MIFQNMPSRIARCVFFLRKPAGREAYPSDVFYLHARLLERSCFLGADGGAGSAMSLPVIETLNNDLAAYIATNVVSITDGQIYLDLALFGVGQCPAVSTEKSVSRIGAKSLDAASRSTAFRLYALVGQVKQEQGARSASQIFRAVQFKKFIAFLVQRSCQAKSTSGPCLLALHSDFLVAVPTRVLGIFALSLAKFST